MSSECFRVNLARLREKQSSRSSANHHCCFLCKLDVGLFIRLHPEIEQYISHSVYYNILCIYNVNIGVCIYCIL